MCLTQEEPFDDDAVKILGLAIEIGLHELDTCVEMVADLRVVIYEFS